MEPDAGSAEQGASGAPAADAAGQPEVTHHARPRRRPSSGRPRARDAADADGDRAAPGAGTGTDVGVDMGAVAAESVRRAARRLRHTATRLTSSRPGRRTTVRRNPAPPPELLTFMRDLTVALVRASEPVARVLETIEEIGKRYGLTSLRTVVMPTSVFVRVGAGRGAAVDFAPVGDPLRLDQVERLYDFIGELRDRPADSPLDPHVANERLAGIYAMRPRFGAPARVVAYMVQTLGLGMITQPRSPATLIGFAALGLAVGTLIELANRIGRTLSLALPVLASIMVTALAFRYSGSLLHENPAKLIIPPLLGFLPGSALTMGTMELATGSIVSGASRLVYGLNVLVLLAFGIAIGVGIVDHSGYSSAHSQRLGVGVTWIGVLLLGVGFAVGSSASLRTLPWLLLVLSVAKGAQYAGVALAGSLLGSFAGGLTLPVITALIQRVRSAPPAQVTYLPAFWMLVPGSLGLSGVGDLLAGQQTSGVGEVVTALLTVVAVALGIMVGANALARATPVLVVGEPNMAETATSSQASS